MARPVRFVLLLALLSACKAKTGVAEPEVSAPTPQASAEQTARKARSEARLRAEGVKINPTLPCIEDKSAAKIRSKDEVVNRAFALALVAVKAEGLEQPSVLKFRDDLGVAPFLSPKESAFVANESPDQKTRAQFDWRYEAAHVMHWALGYVDKLDTPKTVVDAGQVVRLIRKPGPTEYRANAKLRSADELLDEADLIYRYDWACVDARVKGQPKLESIDCEIVVERHQALNWLIGYQGQAWDEVSTDT